MIYLGHFSFFSADDGSGRGYLTCVAEAESIGAALEKFKRLLRRLAGTDRIFSEAVEVYLDASIEIRSIPRKGFLVRSSAIVRE